jgi:ATP-dependent Clp protease protease subunit
MASNSHLGPASDMSPRCPPYVRADAPPDPSTPSPSDPTVGRGSILLASERLFASRTVLVFGEVTPTLAEQVSLQLLALASHNREPIRVFINSPGGHVESGDTIHDMLRFIDAEVNVIGSGWVASAGALIFAAAERSRRICLPNTRFLLHEPSGGMRGQAADIEIEARQVLAMRARLNAIFARATGQSVEKIGRDTERNHWMNAEEALAYGLVGRIVERATEL